MAWENKQILHLVVVGLPLVFHLLLVHPVANIDVTGRRSENGPGRP
jgi:hypothetical protein